MSGRKVQAAYVEDADDESGRIFEETKVTASVASSPTKEKANSKKSRQSPSPATMTDSDSTTIMSPRSRREKESKSKGKDRERERERASDRERKDREREDKHKRTSSKPTTVTFSSKPERPSAKHAKTSPVLHHSARQPSESEYYGVASEQRDRTVAHRAGRSLSYHGGKSPYHPPQSNAQFYAHQTPNAFLPNHANHANQSPYQQPYGSSYPLPAGGPPPPPEYFEQVQQNNLKQRFETGPRSASAMGHRPQRKSLYEREYEDDVVPRRKSSVKKRDVDRERMPPPPRPKTTKPTQTVLRPPPPQAHRNRAYEEDDLLAADASMYREVSKHASGDYSALLPRPRRPSVLYHDNSPYNALIQPSNSIRSRPNSYYGHEEFDYSYGHGGTYGADAGGGGGYSGGLGDSYEERIAIAEAYQNHVNGGLQPLTKDALQKASKRSHGGSSRSTRSSGSRDESDYRHSNTTRTTRSISGEEDLTIKVPGNTVIEVQGAKIQCRDGGEVNITSSRQGPAPSRASSSDKESTVYYEERPSRGERPQFRNRAMSQSSSWSRTYPHANPHPNPHPLYPNYI